MIDPRRQHQELLTRRHFFGRTSTGIGVAALANLLGGEARAGGSDGPGSALTHFPPTAKRVIYLFMSGAPSHLDLFDYKPRLREFQGTELPDSVRRGQRLTGMTAAQGSFPVAPSTFKFQQHGASGAWLSSALPHTAKVADDLCFVRSMHTEAINHDPAVTFFQTGAQIAGRPSIGAWASYGLGSDNKDLPAFVVMLSVGAAVGAQPLADRMWGSGFLPTKYQGVKFRSGAEAVLYLSDPAGFSPDSRRRFLDDLSTLNQMQLAEFGDPEISTRIAQYELAYRMQTSVPELTDIAKEPSNVLEMYGPEVKQAGTFASNCLLARRLAERGVRFIELFHRGWDHHMKLPELLGKQTRQTDQPCAALIQDLKQRGMLDDTLVVWVGEFGRTVYCQGKLTAEEYGRDHHPRCFSMWMAGGGVKPGITYGETDDYGYNVVSDPVHVHDLNATIMRCLGVDHTRLTFKFQGRHFRLTDVAGNVVTKVLSDRRV